MVTCSRAILDIQQTKLVAAALDPNCREPDKVLPEPLSLIAAFLQSCPWHRKKMQTLYSLQCLSAGGSGWNALMARTSQCTASSGLPPSSTFSFQYFTETRQPMKVNNLNLKLCCAMEIGESITCVALRHQSAAAGLQSLRPGEERPK